MVVVFVNNDAANMAWIAQKLKEVHKDLECLQFTDPLLSVKFIWNNNLDMVFADERMRPANEIDLLRIIRQKKSELTVIILAEDSDLREQAESFDAVGYWLKTDNLKASMSFRKNSFENFEHNYHTAQCFVS